jgi:hypothetical protein
MIDKGVVRVDTVGRSVGPNKGLVPPPTGIFDNPYSVVQFACDVTSLTDWTSRATLMG